MPVTTAAAPIRWIDDNHFEIRGVRFFATVDPSEYHHRRSTSDEFLLVKNRAMIDEELSATSGVIVRNILDIGIWQGGSVALYDQIFCPDRLVAIDFSTTPLEALAEYISRQGRAASVQPYYGVDQGNVSRMSDLLRREFPMGIDLVVDDGSHYYRETRATFSVAFPYLRPGGCYIIEDWQWAHVSDLWKLEYFNNQPALTNLLIELAILTASRPDLLAEIRVTPTMLVIKRGAAPLPRALFDLSSNILSRGQPVTPLL